jgi:hypothetical protein
VVIIYIHCHGRHYKIMTSLQLPYKIPLYLQRQSRSQLLNLGCELKYFATLKHTDWIQAMIISTDCIIYKSKIKNVLIWNVRFPHSCKWKVTETKIKRKGNKQLICRHLIRVYNSRIPMKTTPPHKASGRKIRTLQKILKHGTDFKM